MASVNSGVKNVRASASTGAVVVGVGGAAATARDAAETPRGIGLRDVGVDGGNGVLFDEVYLSSCQSYSSR